MLSSGWRLRGARGGWPGILTIVTGVRWALWLMVATGLEVVVTRGWSQEQRAGKARSA